MDKPVVFLSHSSKDWRELFALKKLLDERSIGAIHFFLSSDNESIRSGTLWPEEIKKGLENASLMLAFISPAAIRSGWTYFEAGYGFRKLGRVIPFCLPGTDRGKLPPPLNLLQARNLHSARDLGELVRECNTVFKTNMSENFHKDEFDRIFVRHPEWDIDQPIDWTTRIRKLEVSAVDGDGAARIFAKICKVKGLDCDASSLKEFGNTVVASGVRLTAEYISRVDIVALFGGRKRSRRITKIENDAPSKYRYNFRLAPELVHVTFPVIDAWKRKASVNGSFEVEIVFTQDVSPEEPHQLTRRIFGSEISMLSDGKFRFRKVEFRLTTASQRDSTVALNLTWPSVLVDLPLGDLVIKLFQLGVLSIDKRVKLRSR